MIANAKSTKQGGPSRADLPSLEDVRTGRISLDEYERVRGEDIPDLTDTALADAVSLAQTPDLARALERARGQRGPQKAPVKERVGLRLDRDVLEHFRQGGPGWQGRINAVLADYVKSDERQS